MFVQSCKSQWCCNNVGCLGECVSLMIHMLYEMFLQKDVPFNIAANLRVHILHKKGG